MAENPIKFGKLLKKAVRTIAARQDKAIGIVQDELGNTLYKTGASIVHWEKGHIPANLEDLSLLTRELIGRRGLEDKTEAQRFLDYGGHPYPDKGADELWPPSNKPGQISRQKTKEVDLELEPFVVDLPIMNPRQFFGRTEQLKKIFNRLKGYPLQNIGIIGRWRAGKTSLLRYIKNITQTAPINLRPDQKTNWLPQAEKYHWVLINFNEPMMRRQRRLLHHLLTHFQMPTPDLEACDLETFWDIVMNHELQKPTIILMDEIRLGMESEDLDMDFWNSLRSLVTNHTGGKLAFLVTSQKPLIQQAKASGKPSPFFNIFTSVEVGSLTDEESLDLIKSSPKPFKDDDIKWILDQSERWPYLLQILCRTRLMSLEDGQTDDDSWKKEGLDLITPIKDAWEHEFTDSNPTT